MASSPTLVPVRLTCRYSNGLMMSFVGRALSYEHTTLKVLVNEKFEAGIPLTATCGLLSGPAGCRVAKVCPSESQPGYFLVELRVLTPPKAPPPPAVPEVLKTVAAELAERLAAAPAVSLETALGGLHPGRVSAGLAAAAAALLLVLQEKGQVDAQALVHSMESHP